MENKYQEWIDKNYPTWESAISDCGNAVQKMKEVFPELEVKAGWISGSEHWWCVDPQGNIVDPTLVQYIGRGIKPPFHYKEFQPGMLVRVGRCMNCGDDIYKQVQTLEGNRVSICSNACERAYIKYVEGECR